MSRFDDVDMASLPAPDVVETIDYATILAEILTRYGVKAAERGLDVSATTLLESDPARILLEVAAEYVVIERQRKNDAARAVMLAKAKGKDLDVVVAHFKVKRQVIDPGDPVAIPPVDPTYESDDSLRRRAHLAYEALSVAGPRGAYIFHALSAHPKVRDAWPEMVTPGHILVTILGSDGDGTPDDAILAAVRNKLAPADQMQELRPDSDAVTIQAAQVIHYRIRAELDLSSLPDAEAALAEAKARGAEYASKQHKLGEPVAHSGIEGAMHVAAVREVIILDPPATLPADPHRAYYCDGIDVALRGMTS